jgi:hypothetical protein
MRIAIEPPGHRCSPRLGATLAGLFIAVALIAASASRAQPSAVGTEFSVDASGGDVPDVAIDHDGDFVVTWIGEGVRAQRFDRLGRRRGTEIRVSTLIPRSTSTIPTSS